MTQPTTTLVAAADHADALIVARRAKTTLCLLLFFVLGTELTLFFLLRYVPSLAGLTAPPPYEAAAVRSRAVLQYGLGLLDFAGLILPVLLAVTVLVILQVQLVARLVGTGRVVGGLVWAVIVALLLFPWQAVLNNPAITADAAADAIGLKVPGVVYTWAEVSHPLVGAHFAEFNAPGADVPMTVLHWMRYAGWPVLAMIFVGIVHTKTERGLRQSFGTFADEPESVETTSSVVVTDAPQL